MDAIRFVPWSEGYRQALTGPDTVLFSTVRLPERENTFLWAGPITSEAKVLFASRTSGITVQSSALPAPPPLQGSPGQGSALPVLYAGKADAAGFAFRDAIVSGALANGTGWVEYVWTHPDHASLFHKTTYYRCVTYTSFAPGCTAGTGRVMRAGIRAIPAFFLFSLPERNRLRGRC